MRCATNLIATGTNGLINIAYANGNPAATLNINGLSAAGSVKLCSNIGLNITGGVSGHSASGTAVCIQSVGPGGITVLNCTQTTTIQGTSCAVGGTGLSLSAPFGGITVNGVPDCFIPSTIVGNAPQGFGVSLRAGACGISTNGINANAAIAGTSVFAQTTSPINLQSGNAISVSGDVTLFGGSICTTGSVSGGNVSLFANSGAITGKGGTLSTLAGGLLTLQALTSGICVKANTQNLSALACSAINVADSAAGPARVSASASNVTVSNCAGITVLGITATGGGLVCLSAPGGAILSCNGAAVIAGRLRAGSGAGVGAALNPLQTTVSQLCVLTCSSVNIANSNVPLKINSVIAQSGNITISNNNFDFPSLTLRLASPAGH